MGAKQTFQKGLVEAPLAGKQAAVLQILEKFRIFETSLEDALPTRLMASILQEKHSYLKESVAVI